jgi:hypothetical protein
VSHHGPLARVLIWTGLGCAGFLALAGGLALWGPGLVAVGVGGLLAAGTAAGIARESTAATRRSTVESAVQAAGWTVCGLLVLAGVSALAGGVVAAFAVLAVLLVLLIRWGRSGRLAAAAGHPLGAPRAPTGSPVRLLPVPPPDGAEAPWQEPVPSLAPVTDLPTRELGREWTRTTQALAGRLDPRVRALLVQRRQETLDELERRDTDGFARWLAVGPVADSDPADYVRGDRRQDGAAETDAA